MKFLYDRILGKRRKNGRFMDHMPVYINKLYSGMGAIRDKLNGYRDLKKEFYEKMNYELDLKSPRSFNQKIQWKKINDRNPLLTVTSDKFAVRSYIREVLGEKQANKILIPLYFVTSKPEDIPFDELPEKFVMKPNHGSQMHLMVRNKNVVTRDRLIFEGKKWLRNNFGFYTHEWAYRNINRKIIFEKLLETNQGDLPMDYKLYCFHGKCKIIRVVKNRFDREVVAGYFDTGWNLMDVEVRPFRSNNYFEKPDNLEEMIGLAEKLSQSFDFVRVDLFNMDSELYFGELTHYEFSGFGRFEPESFDFLLGSYWDEKPVG